MKGLSSVYQLVNIFTKSLLSQFLELQFCRHSILFQRIPKFPGPMTRNQIITKVISTLCDLKSLFYDPKDLSFDPKFILVDTHQIYGVRTFFFFQQPRINLFPFC